MSCTFFLSLDDETLLMQCLRCQRAEIEKQTNECIYSWRRVEVTKRLRFESNNKKTQSMLTVKISKNDNNLKDCSQNDIRI